MTDDNNKFMQAQLRTLEKEYSPALVEVLRDILKGQDDIKTQISDLNGQISTINTTLSSTARAFVNQDFEGHRRYHQSVIEWHETRNSLIKAALMQAAKVGGAAAIVWIGYALWQAFKMELMK